MKPVLKPKVRDLNYWIERCREVSELTNRLAYELRTDESGYKYSYAPIKLKKQYGHALNRDYDGYKIYKRRVKSLKRRLILVTKIGKARREIKRLEATKLPFYKNKIETLGGTVPEVWAMKMGPLRKRVHIKRNTTPKTWRRNFL